MSQRVFLHVGTPKTGTSYLQDVLFRNRERLLEAGLCYPADRFDAHFLAALDLLRLPWGGLEEQAHGAWDRLAAQVRAHPGTSIISHEVLAKADAAQVARALADLGHRDDGTGAEVHLVVSARDLVRQIPAEWQENVKHRAVVGYAEFLDELRDPARTGRIGSWFWAVQEVPAILERWGAALPPERVHVVTVPPPGAPHDVLWGRFAGLLGLDGLDLDLEVERVNASMGVPETALLRRVNLDVRHRLNPPDYRPLVRELMAHRTLSARRGSPRLTFPPTLRGWVDELGEEWIAAIEAAGYHVVGDLADLRGGPAPSSYADPDQPDPAQVADAAVDAIGALLMENARLHQDKERVAEELGEAYRALERSYLRPTYRWRERTVRRLSEGGVGTRLLGAYRRARGRSSSPA